MFAPEAIATNVWSRRLVRRQYDFMPAMARAPYAEGWRGLRLRVGTQSQAQDRAGGEG